jgi:hypothetical protein
MISSNRELSWLVLVWRGVQPIIEVGFQCQDSASWFLTANGQMQVLFPPLDRPYAPPHIGRNFLPRVENVRTHKPADQVLTRVYRNPPSKAWQPMSTGLPSLLCSIESIKSLACSTAASERRIVFLASASVWRCCPLACVASLSVCI